MLWGIIWKHFLRSSRKINGSDLFYRRAKAACKQGGTTSASSQDESMSIDTEHGSSESDRTGSGTRRKKNVAVLAPGTRSMRATRNHKVNAEDCNGPPPVMGSEAMFKTCTDQNISKKTGAPSPVVVDNGCTGDRKDSPITNKKQRAVLIVSSSDDEEMCNRVVILPPNKLRKSLGRRKSSNTEPKVLSHDKSECPENTNSTEEEIPNFHLLKVKEKASKFEELANRHSDSQDVSDNVVAQSPRPPTLVTRKLCTPVRQPTVMLTKPAAEAAKQAFEKLLGVSPKALRNQPVRRSSRRSSQKVSILARKSLEYRTKDTSSLWLRKMQLMKASNANSSTCGKVCGCWFFA